MQPVTARISSPYSTEATREEAGDNPNLKLAGGTQTSSEKACLAGAGNVGTGGGIMRLPQRAWR